jgi:hypothetical protein
MMVADEGLLLLSMAVCRKRGEELCTEARPTQASHLTLLLLIHHPSHPRCSHCEHMYHVSLDPFTTDRWRGFNIGTAVPHDARQ